MEFLLVVSVSIFHASYLWRSFVTYLSYMTPKNQVGLTNNKQKLLYIFIYFFV